jgi:hypothetical protein
VNASQTEFALRQVSGVLREVAFRFASEVQLHDLVDQVLAGKGLEFVRERQVDQKNRLDFWLPELAIAIEIKVDESMTPALRQVARYLELPGVEGVLLASTCAWARKVPPLVPKYAQRLAVVHLRKQSL